MRWWCAALPIRSRWREKLVEDLDKARPEVIIDIAVMQVSKDKSRTLGLSPPTSATVTLQSNLNIDDHHDHFHQLLDRPTPAPAVTGINLNNLGNLNATNFQVTIPSANLSAVMGDTDTKLIQNPQIRSLDGQKASLKIGDRVPVATGSFQPGIGGVGINPLVNTQFQYIDVGVNIDITPHVHADRRSHAEDHDGSFLRDWPGQHRRHHASPSSARRKSTWAKSDLKDGESSLIGGIMEDSQTRSLSGIPGLAQIPILKYLVWPDHAGSLPG